MRVVLRAVVVSLTLVAGASAATTAPSTRPDADPAWQALSDGRQRDADSIVRKQLRDNPQDARALYMAGVLTRSRFETDKAARYFDRQLAVSDQGPEAEAAKAVLSLDAGGGITYTPHADFAKLHALVAAHPDDGTYPWLLAIECRTYRHNDEGINAFVELGKHFKTGPVLFHQTFANLLDEQERYKESLPHRETAVRLEPAPWSWSGLGDTYWRMGDAKKAVPAYQESVKLDDTDFRILERLAENALAADDGPAAEAAGKRLVELDPDSTIAHAYLGKAYRLEGNHNKVADEMKAICKLRPSDRAQAQRAVQLLRTLGRDAEADALEKGK